MTSLSQKLAISTPGRVCLFGEHQDYLHLPVIAAAISRRIRVEGTRRADNKVNIDLPDIRKRESFEIRDRIPYARERDYFRSGVNVLQREGFRFPYGFDCVVRGDIPINAGTSSSSALVVGWMNFLARMSEPSRVLSPEDLAQFAYGAEVLEFTEPGGMMDHYCTAMGKLIWLESFPTIKVFRFSAELKPFVLGNSHQPKDTKSILANLKNKVLEIVRNLKAGHSEFSLQTITSEELEAYRRELDEGRFRLLQGTVANRDITFEAKETLERTPVDHRRVGQLLNAHHALLRDVQKISTPKIDRMIEAALNAGAYGAKINGSGGGGCMFAYAPENPEAVAESVRRVSEAAVVTVDAGSREEPTEVEP
jgi:galactokinase